MTPHLIIFDCDGVLVDSEVLSCRCVSEVLRAHGAELSIAEVMRLFLGRSRRAILEHFLQIGSPLPPEFPEKLQARVREVFQSDLRAIDGVSAVLDQIEIPYCVASSSDSARLSLSLSLVGLSTYFSDRCFSSELVKAGKPAPDLFLHAAQVFGVPAQDVLVIEDSINGVLAAKAAGMTVWGFVGGSHYEIMPNMSSLQDAGADNIVRSMPELGRALRGVRA